MANKSSQALDKSSENSSNERVGVAICNETLVATTAGGPQAMMASIIPNDILATCLEPLLHYPVLISYYDEDIAEELLARDYFSLSNGEVTAAGRDFLGTHRAVS